MMDSKRTIPCKSCGEPTLMLATKLCDRCWELETRIRRDPKLARQMLEAVEEEK